MIANCVTHYYYQRISRWIVGLKNWYLFLKLTLNIREIIFKQFKINEFTLNEYSKNNTVDGKIDRTCLNTRYGELVMCTNCILCWSYTLSSPSP